MSNFKWTDEKINNYIMENAKGYHLTKIERGTKGGKTRIYLECDKQHNYDVNFDNFQKGRRCPHCDGKVKYKFKYIKNFIETESQSDCKLLSKEYKGIDNKLNIECNCGNEFDVSFYHFKHNKKRQCNDCKNKDLSERFRASIDKISESIKTLSDGNCSLVSTEYINGKTPITLLCNCGNEFDVKYNDFLSNKQYQCPDCGLKNRIEKRRFSFEEVKSDIQSNGYKLISTEYIGASEALTVLCNKEHISDIIYNNFRRGARCQQCYFDSMGGENSYNWKGGISPLTEYLRHNITKWKNDSKENSNYKCVVTGDKFSVIHHLYPFNKIFKETIEELNLPIYENVSLYENNELELLKEKCLEIHYRYPLGVCLRDDVHYLFHRLYTKDNNTPEQFEEFKIRYRDGEFKGVI